MLKGGGGGEVMAVDDPPLGVYLYLSGLGGGHVVLEAGKGWQ